MTEQPVFPDTLTPSSLAEGLHTARLPNGLRVIIKEDHRSPVAICNAWVRVGSNREPEKMRGWSHGIEHMLFKGTELRNEGDFANEVADAGGSTNAGTGYETTNYHITVPSAQLAVAVDILADVLFHSTFDPESLDAERKVLVHENHMYDDIPFGFGVTWRWGMEMAYDESPYHHPIGGQDKNLLERDREDILAFFRSAYRPDNMTVVVVGDFEPQAAFAAVAEKFGGITPSDEKIDASVSIVPDPTTEPRHEVCRLRVEHGDIQRAYAKLIFPGPAENDPARPVLSMVRRVLSDGRSCRLYRRVQEELKLIDEFAVMTEAGPREGVFLIDIETDPERLAVAIEAVAKVLGELAVDGCTDEELERARVRSSRSFLFGAETVQGQASNLGYYNAMDDLPGAFDFPARIAGVSARDVVDFCGRSFQSRDLSCVIYLPRETDPSACGIPTTAEELNELVESSLPGPAQETAAASGPIARVADPGALRTTIAPREGAPSFETRTLSNGIPVHCRRDPTVPIVAMAITARGGALQETASDSGLAALMQMVQLKGAAGMDAESLHEALESEGASLAPRVDRDFTGLFLSGLSDRLDRALELTGRVINEPAFPEVEVEQERRLALEQLESLQDTPFQAAALKLRMLIYGDHPYGRPLIGTAESLPRLDRNDLLSRYEQIWRAENLQVVISGAVEPDYMLERLEKTLGNLPKGPGSIQPVALAPITAPESIVAERITREQNQSVVLAAWPGPMTPQEDRVPLMMLKEVLNGQSGRLFDFLRNQNSLCYNTGTLSTAGFGQGMFLAYVQTAPESEDQALEALIQQLQGMSTDPADGVEFERARAKLLGNLVISSQANSARVSRTDRDLLHGRSVDDFNSLLEGIEKCRPEEVCEVATRLIDPDRRFQVIIGP